MARNPWLRLTLDSWSLGMEASAVIGLRTMALAAGGAGAKAETSRMIREKIDSGLELQARAMTGGLGFTAATATGRTLAHYRKKVRANRRRLSKIG